MTIRRGRVSDKPHQVQRLLVDGSTRDSASLNSSRSRGACIPPFQMSKRGVWSVGVRLLSSSSLPCSTRATIQPSVFCVNLMQFDSEQHFLFFVEWWNAIHVLQHSGPHVQPPSLPLCCLLRRHSAISGAPPLVIGTFKAANLAQLSMQVDDLSTHGRRQID
jgi:hypothetical protein